MDKKDLINSLKLLTAKMNNNTSEGYFHIGLIAEAITYIETEPVAEVPCSAGVMPAADLEDNLHLIMGHLYFAKGSLAISNIASVEEKLNDVIMEVEKLLTWVKA